MENFKRPITLQEVKSFLSKFGTLEYLAMDSCFQLCYATIPTDSFSVADCHGFQRDKVRSNASSVDVEGVVTNMDLDDSSILGDSEPTPTDVFHDVESIADRECVVDQVLSQELKDILNISSGQSNSYNLNEKFKVFQEIKSNEASKSIKDEPDTHSLNDPKKDEFTSKVSVGTETNGSFPGVESVKDDVKSVCDGGDVVGVENVVNSGVDTMGNRDGQLKVEEVKMESSARATFPCMPGSFPGLDLFAVNDKEFIESTSKDSSEVEPVPEENEMNNVLDAELDEHFEGGISEGNKSYISICKNQ